MVGNYRYSKKNNLYILSSKDIDYEAEQVLRKYYPIGLEKPQEIPVDMIIESMNINLLYRRLSKNKEILGGCVFDSGRIPVYDEYGNQKDEIFQPNTIIINSDLADDKDIRCGSTSGHELGHYVTQGDLYIKNQNQLSLFDNSSMEDYAIVCKRECTSFDSIFKEHKQLKTREDWMEWQANYFSTAIIVPKTPLINYLKPYLDKYANVYGKPPLNNLTDYELYGLTSKLAELFHVSQILVIYRLRNLKLLENSDFKEVMTIWQ